MPKRRRKTKPPAKRKPRVLRIREDKLTPMIRQAIRAGCVEAIEHCANFWSIGDGYKKYIDYQIEAQAETFMAAIRSAVRVELSLREISVRRERRGKR